MQLKTITLKLHPKYVYPLVALGGNIVIIKTFQAITEFNWVLCIIPYLIWFVVGNLIVFTLRLKFSIKTSIITDLIDTPKTPVYRWEPSSFSEGLVFKSELGWGVGEKYLFWGLIFPPLGLISYKTMVDRDEYFSIEVPVEGISNLKELYEEEYYKVHQREIEDINIARQKEEVINKLNKDFNENFS